MQNSCMERNFHTITSNDANGALELLREFKEPSVIAVKHANPCGVGCAADICSAISEGL